MPTALKAGCLYFLVVFAAGFVLGTIRTLWLVPAVGAVPAVLIELPVMLALAWLACGAIVRQHPVHTLAERAAMGGTAFVLLMLVEFAVSVFAFGSTAAAYFAALATPAGALGLAGQIAFAAIPLLGKDNSVRPG